jgi:uncharacterized membrane protein AbrB (regulator of aidB expression)
MSIFNQYSFVFIAIVLGLGIAFALWRWQRGAAWLRGGVLALYIVVAVVAGLSLRYPDTTVENVQDAETILTNGNPTFFMFYSNY